MDVSGGAAANPAAADLCPPVSAAVAPSARMAPASGLRVDDCACLPLFARLLMWGTRRNR